MSNWVILVQQVKTMRAALIFLFLICQSALRVEAVQAVFAHVHSSPTINDVRFSSPVLIDLDGNPNTLEIVVGDESGYIYGFDSSGGSLWTFSIREFSGFEGVQTACQSSPAVADLEGDGALEVVVTLASRDEFVASKPGAIFMFRLDQNGLTPTTSGGFARLTLDRNQDQIPDGAFPSPTVVDLDGDGKLEILACSWDELCYALRYDGTLFWNLDNDPTDPAEYGFKTGDTIWTTPAVADIDNDSFPEIVIGVDAQDFPWGHQIPYQTKAGGILVVLDGPTAALEVGPDKFFHESYHEEGSGSYYNPQGDNHIPVVNISEVLQSSPVIADVDTDGLPEIIHGTGQQFHSPTDNLHDRIFCWNAENGTQQWNRYVEGEVFASPAVANVDADPELEIFARNFDFQNPKLFGLDGVSGNIVPGFPVAVRAGNPRSIGAVIGDVDGDGMMEIIVVSYGRLHVFGANGVEESGFDNVPNLMFTSPAIGDIDNDGNCEMVLGNSEGIWIFRCQSGPVGAIPWGQYRRDARNSGVIPLYTAEPVSSEVLGPVVGGDEATVRVAFGNSGSSVWAPENTQILNQTSGVPQTPIPLPPGTWVLNGQTLVLEFSAPVPRQLGPVSLRFQLGDLAGVPFGAVLSIPLFVTELRPASINWRHYR